MSGGAYIVGDRVYESRAHYERVIVEATAWLTEGMEELVAQGKARRNVKPDGSVTYMLLVDTDELGGEA